MADLRLLGKNTVGNQPIAHLLTVGAHTAFHRQMCAQTRTGRLEDLFKVFARVHQAAATVGVASDHKLACEVLRFGPGLKRHGRMVPPGGCD